MVLCSENTASNYKTESKEVLSYRCVFIHIVLFLDRLEHVSLKWERLSNVGYLIAVDHKMKASPVLSNLTFVTPARRIAERAVATGSVYSLITTISIIILII